jgi:hypothetical protein
MRKLPPDQLEGVIAIAMEPDADGQVIIYESFDELPPHLSRDRAKEILDEIRARHVSPEEFRNLLTEQEQRAFLELVFSEGDAEARMLFFKLCTSSLIDMGSPETSSALDYLATKNVISRDRKDQLWRQPSPPKPSKGAST